MLKLHGYDSYVIRFSVETVYIVRNKQWLINVQKNVIQGKYLGTLGKESAI